MEGNLVGLGAQLGHLSWIGELRQVSIDTPPLAGYGPGKVCNYPCINYVVKLISDNLVELEISFKIWYNAHVVDSLFIY